MRKLHDRDTEAMNTWATEILKSRVETGEPYIMYTDNVNKDNPMAYLDEYTLDVSMTNICTEITLHLQMKNIHLFVAYLVIKFG